MKRRQILIGALALALLLAMTAGLSWAQKAEPLAGEVYRSSGVEEAAAVESRIPIQGRLTNASGNPLNGTYSIRFRLYEAATGGTALCEDPHQVSVENGLFYTEIAGNCTSAVMNGQELYLSIKVGTDDEMTDRQAIYPVPYAFSLKPGAIISDTTSYVALNRSASIFPTTYKYGVYTKASGAIYNYGVAGYSVDNYGAGILGSTDSSLGYGGYFRNTAVSGIGLYASAGDGNTADLVLGSNSNTGTGDNGRILSADYQSSDLYLTSNDAVHVELDANNDEDGEFRIDSSGIPVFQVEESGRVRLTGSGIIQSTARSYLWISGNSLQKANSDDTTRWEYDDYGGYKVYAGSDWANPKRVVLPVTLPGQLYGQNVTVTGMDLYYAVNGEFTVIDAIAVRRQDGVGTGNLILYDDTDLNCGQGLQCSKHWDLTQNNVLSDQQGILHIVLRFSFGGQVQYIQIGGMRLTLEHD